jgi:hypothetical protein
VITTPKNRRIVDLSCTSQLPMVVTLRRLYNIKMDERNDWECEMTKKFMEEEIFTASSNVCRNCFSSVSLFHKKENTLLSNIENVFDRCDHDSTTKSTFEIGPADADDSEDEGEFGESGNAALISTPKRRKVIRSRGKKFGDVKVFELVFN